MDNEVVTFRINVLQKHIYLQIQNTEERKLIRGRGTGRYLIIYENMQKIYVSAGRTNGSNLCIFKY